MGLYLQKTKNVVAIHAFKKEIKKGVIPPNSYICGGCFYNFFHTGKFDDGDIDLYFTNQDSFESCLRLFRDNLKWPTEVGGSEFGFPVYKVKSPYGIYNLIGKFGNSLWDVVKDFDYLHTMCGYESLTSTFWISERCMEAIENKQLELNTSAWNSRYIKVNGKFEAQKDKQSAINKRYAKMIMKKGMTPKFDPKKIGVTLNWDELFALTFEQ